jgi:PLP dependent protein
MVVSSRSDIEANIARVRDAMAESAARAHRDTSEIRLVAVSKTFPAEAIVDAYHCGLRHFGENRVQEFLQKRAALDLPGAQFHLIGHLQTNKVSQATAFDYIQTIDSERLALKFNEAAAKAGKKVPVLVEVKLSDEEAKTGIPKQQTQALAEAISDMRNLELRGLMTVPPHTPDPADSRRYFRRLRELRNRLREEGLSQLNELSMGMTRDFPIAIEEGATMIRVGTAIFGARIPHG